MRSSLERKGFWRFLTIATAMSVVVAAGVYAAASRWSIAIDSQENLCLPPYRVWIIDKHQTDPIRGEAFAFTSKGLNPVFPDGTTIVKIVEGMPGDQVSVTPDQTVINGKAVGTGLQVATDLGIPADRYTRTGVIPDDGYWFFGRTADSFDSRYWGSVNREQVLGRAYPIW